MADLYMTELKGFGTISNALAPAFDAEDMITQNVTIGVASADFAATQHPLIQLYAGADCVVSFDGTAAVSGGAADMVIPSGATTQPFAVPTGTVVKVIQL